MIYVISDIHGFWEPYEEVVNSLGNNDFLYILGDALDRGSEGIRILQDIMPRENLVLLKGNHEAMLTEILWELSEEHENTGLIENEVALGDYGQRPTLEAFMNLSKKERLEIATYIEQLPLFASVTVDGNPFLMAHAGIPEECSTETDIEYYADEDSLLWGPHDFTAEHPGVVHLVGHLPTRNIAEAEPDRIYCNVGNIDLDCGLGFGGQLGVLCLDTGEEFYV